MAKYDEYKARALANDVPELIAAAVAEIMVKVREETIEEMKADLEKLAVGHDQLAERHPQGPDRLKANTIRRLIQVL
jgi:hypothetical protein